MGPRVRGKDAVILIGMPGAGKSTVGVLLAKALSCEFVDTDVLIQAREGRRLQVILDREGRARFCAIEEQYLVSLDLGNVVVATGGSAVYSERAMNHLKGKGVAVYLQLPYPELEQRLSDLGSRGVVMEQGQSLRHLYHERVPLYERYADITVACSGLRHEHVVEAILRELDRY